MSEIVAKPIIKNKFWIVEESGHKIGTIQAVDESGSVMWVQGAGREVFPSINTLSKRHNIRVEKRTRSLQAPCDQYEIYGFPTPHKPHNVLYDVKKKLPIFTKTAKSKSYFCAGHYLIRFNQSWSKSYCPKAITLNRYDFLGPFRTLTEVNQKAKEINGTLSEPTDQEI
jgi:hypothetical protein